MAKGTANRSCVLISDKMQGLSEAEMQKMLMFEEMRHYNTVVSTCFSKCVKSMASKKLVPPEITCLENCYKKTGKFNDRFVQALNYVNMTRTASFST